uniref:Uncharacterized protein n=1 Tax=Anopheles atroparvus TaxID=41427 RepID=A0A182IN12_ANOAO
MSSVSGSLAVSAAVGTVATADAITAPVAPAFESSSLSSDVPLPDEDLVVAVEEVALLLLLFSFDSVTIGSAAACGGPSERGSFSSSLPGPPAAVASAPTMALAPPLAFVDPCTGVGVLPVVPVPPLVSVAASLFDSASSNTDPGRLSVEQKSEGKKQKIS